MRQYAVYGITLASDFSFRWPLQAASGPADLVFTCTPAPPVRIDWAAAPAVYEVHSEPGLDVADITYHVTDGIDVVRIRGVADHYVQHDRITCHLHDPVLDYLAEIQLLGMVMALWLERRHVPTLHASCVVVDDRAIAFLGTKGGGKTTAAAAFLAAGHEFLADDLLALTAADETPCAQPGYPMLRMWPDQVKHFLDNGRGLALVHPAFTKRRLRVGDGFGVFRPAPAPLQRIYVPSRHGDADPIIDRVQPRDALIELVRHSFLRDAVFGLNLTNQRFRALSAAVRSVEVRTLYYPDGMDRLPDMVAAVERDLTAG